MRAEVRGLRLELDELTAGGVRLHSYIMGKQSGDHKPISVYRLGEMPIQSCGQSVSAPRGKAGVRLNAHTELRAMRQRSAREAIYRSWPIGVCGDPVRGARRPGRRAAAHQGRAVQVEPIKPTLKAPGSERSKLKYDEPLSTLAFNFNMRRYTKELSYAHAVEASALRTQLADLRAQLTAALMVGRCRLTLSDPR